MSYEFADFTKAKMNNDFSHCAILRPLIPANILVPIYIQTPITLTTGTRKKAIPITGLWGPGGSGRLRLQITRHSTHEGGKIRPPYAPAAFKPRNILVLSFRG